MSGITRRRLLAGLGCGAASLLAVPLLAACGERPVATTQPVSRPGTQVATPGTPGAASVVPVTASSPAVAGTATAFVPDFGWECRPRNYRSSPEPSDPFSYILYAEGGASYFANHVRYAPLIVLIDNSRYLPPRWTTADGRRPSNPHVENLFGQPQYTIVTPERAEVLQVAKGEYDHKEIYFAH